MVTEKKTKQRNNQNVTNVIIKKKKKKVTLKMIMKLRRQLAIFSAIDSLIGHNFWSKD